MSVAAAAPTSRAAAPYADGDGNAGAGVATSSMGEVATEGLAAKFELELSSSHQDLANLRLNSHPHHQDCRIAKHDHHSLPWSLLVSGEHKRAEKG